MRKVNPVEPRPQAPMAPRESGAAAEDLPGQPPLLLIFGGCDKIFLMFNFGFWLVLFPLLTQRPTQEAVYESESTGCGLFCL